MTTKKNRKTQVLTARLVTIICVIALTIGAFLQTKTSITILRAQWKMHSYYSDIQKAISLRDYCSDIAIAYQESSYFYSSVSDDLDFIAYSIELERKDFVANATDPVVKWACRDGVEFLTILAGIAELIMAVALWILDVFLILILDVACKP